MKIVIILLVLGLLYIGLNVECIKTGYEINKLKLKKIELINENNSLKVELAKERSLERIESIARGELGLITPEKFETIVLPEVKEEKPNFLNKIKLIFKKVVSSILGLL
jgi:cell division protein FtsL